MSVGSFTLGHAMLVTAPYPPVENKRSSEGVDRVRLHTRRSRWWRFLRQARDIPEEDHRHSDAENNVCNRNLTIEYMAQHSEV
jgi:hypothetical protein